MNELDLNALKALKTLLLLEMETFALMNIFYSDRKRYEATNIISNKIGWMEDNEDILNFALPTIWFRGYTYEEYRDYDRKKIDWQHKKGFASKEIEIKEDLPYG